MSTAIVCVHSVGSNMLCTGFDRALFCGVVPQFVRYSRLHLVRMVLNVVVLGLWSGTFVSYVVLLNLFSNGVSLISVLLPSVCRYHQCAAVISVVRQREILMPEWGFITDYTKIVIQLKRLSLLNEYSPLINVFLNPIGH